jgi:hypothetical protein
MNFVSIPAGHPEDPLYVMCADHGAIAKVGPNEFDRANEIKIEHENEHGIFLDTIMGEGLYYDPEEDQYINDYA